jgi:hypothetical protein
MLNNIYYLIIKIQISKTVFINYYTFVLYNIKIHFIIPIIYRIY